MNEITKDTLTKAYKPYDVISDIKGNVGFIQEVSVNDSQDGFDDQISYSIKWIAGYGDRSAWYGHNELKFHCNIFISIAECSCHPMGRNAPYVEALFNHRKKAG